MPDTQVERISQLDIGDGKLYEFAGANNGMVFNDVTEALAAIQAGTVADGDVFYIKNDGTSGYPVFIGTSAQIAAADNTGKLLPGMLIYCTDDGVNDITALQVSYGNTTVKAKLDDIIDNLGNTDISDIGDGTVTGGISQLNSDLDDRLKVYRQYFSGTSDASNGLVYLQLPENAKPMGVQLDVPFNNLGKSDARTVMLRTVTVTGVNAPSTAYTGYVIYSL